MVEVAGVELRDIASAKIVRIPVTSADYNILTRGGELEGNKRPCRAIVIATAGPLVVRLLDDTIVTLPDTGGAWQWNIQAQALIGDPGNSPDVVIYY